jgi:hypothetical protein
MNDEIMNHVKNTILSSLYSENVFDKFIESCQEYYNKPVHSLQEMKKIKTTKLKGDIFEHFCYLYVKYVMKLNDVWLLKDLPDHIRQQLKLKRTDLGIDIIAKDNDKFIAIQVKYRNQNKRKTLIGWKELSTFYALVYRSGPFNKHIVFTNAYGVRHIGEKMDKDKSICNGTLRNIKYELWLNMIGSIGNVLDEKDNTEKIDINELRLKRLQYYEK